MTWDENLSGAGATASATTVMTARERKNLEEYSLFISAFVSVYLGLSIVGDTLGVRYTYLCVVGSFLIDDGPYILDSTVTSL